VSGTVQPRTDDRPHAITFLSGHTEGESELSFANAFAAAIPWPDVRVDVVTGNPDFGARWASGDVHHVELPAGRVPVVHESRWLVMRALMEGLLDEADIVVSTSWYRAMMAWIVGTDELFKYRGQRIRPLLYLCPQVNDEYEFEATGTPMAGYRRADDLWWETMSRWPTMHSIHPAAWDRDEGVKRVLRVAANPPLERLHTWERWEYDGPVPTVEREAKVVWTGRIAPLKDPAMASDIGHLLAGMGRTFEAYAVTASAGTRGGKFGMPNLVVGLPQAEFHRRAGGAAVQLITSHREAGILSLWELAERGVVPVVRDKPWARRALPGWPLLFRNVGDAAAMCDHVLDTYDRWSGELDALLASTYPVGTINGPSVWEEVWRQWQAWTHTLDVRSTSRRPRGMLDTAKGLGKKALEERPVPASRS
jgi:hypothetical protein